MSEGSQGFESVEVTRLRREIESAWGAFDDIDQMAWDHRVLVVRYVIGALPDAARFPPPWASICTGWVRALAASRAAVEFRDAPVWVDDEPAGAPAGSAPAHSVA
jgi:hypothetical protein